MALSQDQAQAFVPQPRHPCVRLIEPRGDQQRVVGALLEPYHDFALRDRDFCRGVDEVAEQMAGLGGLVAVADADGQQAVQAARHQRQLQVAVDLHRHRRGERVHVEEVDPILDVLFR